MCPNVEGNRPAALTVTEAQSMNRRVRLTVRLGGELTDAGTGQHENAGAHDMMRFCLAPGQAARVGYRSVPPAGPDVQWQKPSLRLKMLNTPVKRVGIR